MVITFRKGGKDIFYIMGRHFMVTRIDSSERLETDCLGFHPSISGKRDPYTLYVNFRSNLVMPNRVSPKR